MQQQAAAEERYVNGFVEEGQLVLLRRNQHGEMVRRVKKADYSCFVKRADLSPDILRGLRGSPAVIGLAEEGDYTRIRFADDELRRNIVQGPDRNQAGYFETIGLTTLEGDVHPMRRFFSDSGASIQMPRAVFLDIETDSRQTFVNARGGKARLLSYALVDLDGDTTIDVLEGEATDSDAVLDANEKALLERMWRALEAYDLVMAWSGKDFDFLVIEKRSQLLGVVMKDIRRWLWLDHLALYQQMNAQAAASGEEKESLKLEAVAYALLGEGKDKEPGIDALRSLGAQTWDMWAAGGEWRRRLALYNLQDTDLLRKIEKKTGYFALFLTLCEVCKCFPETRSLDSTQQVDGYMLRLGIERSVHFPTRKFGVVAPQFAGALVEKPSIRGIGHHVHVADFKSMYPTIIITWNMSPETKRAININGPIPPGYCRAPSTRMGFATGVMGILSGALRDLLRLRDYWTKLKATLVAGSVEWEDADRRAKSYKVAANSFYGVIGSPFSRYFDSQIAESVTQNGVWLIRLTAEAAKARGWSVVYIDTDSIFVCGPTKEEFKAFTIWCNTELYPTKIRETGCTENLIEIDYEKEFKNIIFISAKKYCGWYEHYKGKVPDPLKSKPEVRGLEWRRGDATKLARELQWKAILLLTRDCCEDPLAFIEMVEKAQHHVLEDVLPVDEVVQNKSLNKNPKEYKTKLKKDGTSTLPPAHVRIALEMKARGEEVHEGIRVSYFVKDASKSPAVVAAADEYDGTNADRFYIWEDQVWKPTKRLLEAAFPEFEWKGYNRVRPRKPGSRVDVQVAPGVVRKLRTARAVPEEQGGLFGNGNPGSHSNVPPPPIVFKQVQ